jgi:hypothetical protein
MRSPSEADHDGGVATSGVVSSSRPLQLSRSHTKKLVCLLTVGCALLLADHSITKRFLPDLLDDVAPKLAQTPTVNIADSAKLMTGAATVSRASTDQLASLPTDCDSHHSAVEIGTSNFDTIIQQMARTEPKATGLSVDAMQIYIDQLPNLECWRKLASAVVGSTEDIPQSGMIDTYFIDPKDIAQHSLPDWLRGCNSVGRPHATALKELTTRNLPHLMHNISVPVVSVEQLLDNNEICHMKRFKVDVEGFDGDLLVAFSKWVLKKNGACYADEVYGEFNELSDGRVSGDEAGLALAEAGYEETGKDGFDRIWKYVGKR